MRIAKPHLINALTGTPLPTASHLHLSSLNMCSLSVALLECEALERLELECNDLTKVDGGELRGCGRLFELGLANNGLESLAGIDE